jgi:hypothetical protein
MDTVTDTVASDSPSTIDVHGVVVGRVGAAANLTVRIQGHPTVMTDSSGAFTISGVTVPYDVAIVDSANKLAAVHQGLTRPNPTLVLPNPLGTMITGAVSGTFSGGKSGDSTFTTFDSPDTAQMGNTYAAGVTAFSDSFYWFGSSTTTGTLRAFQMQLGGNMLPSVFDGYGELPNVVLSNGGSVTGQVISIMTAPPNGALSGSYTVPPGYTVFRGDVCLQASGHHPLGIYFDTTKSSSFAYVIPQITGVTWAIQLVAQGPSLSAATAWQPGLAAGTSGLNVTAPSATTLMQPADAATGVGTTAMFSWMSEPSAVYIVSLEPMAAGWVETVFTTATTMTIPDLSALGAPLASGTSYQWYVSTVGPLAGEDDFATPTGVSIFQGFGTVAASFTTQSATRTFTTP